MKLKNVSSRVLRFSRVVTAVRTWQGTVAGAAGGAIVGGVGYGATCWW